MVRHIKAHARRHVHLEVVRAVDEVALRTAAGKRIAERPGFVKLYVYRAQTGLKLRHDSLQPMRRGHPDGVEIIKQRPIAQACIRALRKSKVCFRSDSEVRREHEVAAEFSESAGHSRRVEKRAVAERID